MREIRLNKTVSIISILILIISFSLIFMTGASTKGFALTPEEQAYLDKLRTHPIVIAYSYDLIQAEFNGEQYGILDPVLDVLRNEFGLTVNMKKTNWYDVFSQVESGDVDFYGPIAISESRRQKYITVDPFYRSYSKIMTRISDPVHSMMGLYNRSIGLLEGSVISRTMQSYLGPNGRIIYFPTMDDMITGLRTGVIDAFATVDNAEFEILRHNDIQFEFSIDNFFVDQGFISGREDMRALASLLSRYLEENPQISDEIVETRHQALLRHARERLADEIKYLQANYDEATLYSEMILYPLCYSENGDVKGMQLEINGIFEELTSVKIRFDTDENYPAGIASAINKLKSGECMAFVGACLDIDTWNDPAIQHSPRLWLETIRTYTNKDSGDSLSGKTIGAMSFASDYLGWNNTTGKAPVLFNSGNELLNALKTGEIDAVFMGEMIFNYCYSVLRDYSLFEVTGISAEAPIHTLYGTQNEEFNTLFNESITLFHIMNPQSVGLWKAQSEKYKSDYIRMRYTGQIVYTIIIAGFVALVAALLYMFARNRQVHKRTSAVLADLTAIIAIADAGIIVKDKNGVVREWNIGAENILGYTPEEIIGKTTHSYAPEEGWAGIDKVEAQLANGEHTTHVDVIRKHKDGRLIDCSASYTPIFDNDGNFNGSVAIFHDISDKKRIEQELHNAVLVAQHANEAKSSFLANMSHEIRTPLNGIIGFAELAADDYTDPEKTKGFLEKIKVSGEGLLKIINDILDISKIEAGKMDLEKTLFSIHDVLEHCQTINSLKADEKGIALYFYTEPPIHKKLLGDPTKLRQVLLNLISNAIKFTNKGMVKVMAVIEDESEENVTIRFEVKDNGIGLTQEQIQKIFEPFAQADSSTTRKYGGTGLGLTITKDIIELMGGKLKVESTPGMGSKFSFSLKLEKGGPLDKLPAYNAMKIGKHQRPNFVGDVLVCEDNDINQQVIEGHLTRVGLHTTIVENGKLGVDAVMNKLDKPYDIIFMDIHMPVMDGLEAAQKLADLGNTTPVIALTANAMSKDIETYLNNGMSDYLAKPFVAQDLWKCLMKFITPVSMVNLTETEQTGSNSAKVKSEQNSLFERQAGIEQSGGDEALYNQLLARFSKKNQSTFGDIKNAIEVGDYAYAYRLTHTLKGVAGTLGAFRLRDAAKAVEDALSGDGLTATSEQLWELKTQINAVLAELLPLLEENSAIDRQAGELNVAGAAKLLDELVPMLKEYNTKSLELIPKIYEILSPTGAEADNLIKQIEDFDFELAVETAELLRQLI